VQQVGLVQQQNGAPVGNGGVLSPRKQPFPEARQRSLGCVGRRIDRLPARLLRDLEQQRCLADLPGTGEQLDSPRGGLGQPLDQRGPTGVVGEPEVLR